MRRDEARRREAAEPIAQPLPEHVGEADEEPAAGRDDEVDRLRPEEPPGRGHRHRQPGRVERDDGALGLARHVAEGREEARREARAQRGRERIVLDEASLHPQLGLAHVPVGVRVGRHAARVRDGDGHHDHDQQDSERGCERMQPRAQRAPGLLGAWTDRAAGGQSEEDEAEERRQDLVGREAQEARPERESSRHGDHDRPGQQDAAPPRGERRRPTGASSRKLVRHPEGRRAAAGLPANGLPGASPLAADSIECPGSRNRLSSRP